MQSPTLLEQLELLGEHIRAMSRRERIRYMESVGVPPWSIPEHLERWDAEYGPPRRFEVIEGGRP